MSQSFGGVEFLEAEYSLGMCGHFVFRRNEDRKRFRICHTMSHGKSIEVKRDGNWETVVRDRATDEQVIELFPPEFKWTMQVIIAHWAGFAAGHYRGNIDGRDDERERQARKAK